ncbi:MAG: YceD family protein [Chloroflexota bacterium]
MPSTSHSYVNSRVLKLNVGFLLNAGPGHSRDSELDIPTVRVSDDLLLEYLRGKLRLSHTKEGILVQAHLDTAVHDECYRCLDPVLNEISLELEELYTTQPHRETEFQVSDDGILDLAPLLRAETLIEESHRVLCQDDCKGICPQCGVNRNRETCDCDVDDIDPRLAALKQLLDSN